MIDQFTNFNTLQLCENYFEAQRKETEASRYRKEVRDEIINRMKEDSVTSYQADGKCLRLESLNKWTYSPELMRLEAELEAKKEIERKTGGAQSKPTPFIRVKDAKGSKE
jgi:hypothetical protein